MLRIYNEWLTQPKHTARGIEMQKYSANCVILLTYDVQLVYIG
jgi:hypothetical protein